MSKHRDASTPEAFAAKKTLSMAIYASVWVGALRVPPSKLSSIYSLNGTVESLGAALSSAL